ncbi:double-strand break repair helicase AddA [Sabulicella glaciei]|uniref:DNA 3'-5' helicase n=1 Tax=Sabulicella glaciei TaxID=2984948 RepID=A0ABT3NX80_9PROT|nr:double-strand break repair helicase AddA [Roseococcus sp. MDT2-1-1]MCW8086731.1 double-strand break repair helicase AddA [Roseococcus sp. MDT2-1-1]
MPNPQARDIAAERQRQASDPAVSAFVTASAGSGKTKLLTDRILRLLLAGARPQGLLCLTFTKAAAAEMATRLNTRLGDWAVETDAALLGDLRALLGRVPEPEEAARARQLFAEVLELPGGMRIATIHAFAQSLLRGFPLEAGLAPGFSLLEEMDAAAELAGAREAVLPEAAEAALLAPLAGGEQLARLMTELRGAEARLTEAVAQSGGLEGLLARIARRLGIPAGMDEDGLLHVLTHPPEEAAIGRAATTLASSRNGNDAERGEQILGFLARDAEARAATAAEWEAIFLTDKRQPRARLATKDSGDKDGIEAVLKPEAARLAGLVGLRAAINLWRATGAALGLALPVLRRFRDSKAVLGRQDYDDLIAGARRLLENPGAAWVLYKLDGGIEHLLLDEAQDSNPEQWGIVRALTNEFFAGEGAEFRGRSERTELPRTIFAVGDVKQSIYGFQGADAAGLPRALDQYGRDILAAKEAFRAVPLEVSFRSAPAVLSLVDAVFADGSARGGVVAEGEALRHIPDRAGAAGLVEMWPLQAGGETEGAPAWDVPGEARDETGPDARLAEALAARIRHMLDHEVLEARHEGDPSRGRRIRPGDILVLVRRRNAFVGQLVKALKNQGVPVGGADRMVLIEQIAVQDVLATLDAILLPEDDLQLAAALKSPIFGLEEEDLFALAWNRGGSLHARLMAQRGAETPIGRAADLLAALEERADHVPPHALLAELLGERGARARLLARLGPDAADPLDELLNAALGHEAAHPHALQSFLHWLRRAAPEVKRQAESGADQVRIMTVHGAKGLQAPVVILPDITGSRPRESGLRWTADGLPLWAPKREGFATPDYDAAVSESAAREAEEMNRLLYVALTRAEDRLLVCGWYRAKLPEDCWHARLLAGFRRLGAEEAPFDPEGFGARADGFEDAPLLRHATPQRDRRRDESRPARAEAEALPAWARLRATPAEPEPILTPSRQDDEGEGDGPALAPHGEGDRRAARFRRGNLVHALLQSLPGLAPGRRVAAGASFLSRPAHGLSPQQQTEILREALAVMEHPALRAAFGPGSLAEAPLAARLRGRLVAGQVDRLLLEPGCVTILDYKTNREPPATPEEAPEAYLRQMAAYRAVLRQIHPDKAVECALVWTVGARAMPLPHDLLDRFAPA